MLVQYTSKRGRENSSLQIDEAKATAVPQNRLGWQTMMLLANVQMALDMFEIIGSAAFNDKDCCNILRRLLCLRQRLLLDDECKTWKRKCHHSIIRTNTWKAGQTYIPFPLQFKGSVVLSYAHCEATTESKLIVGILSHVTLTNRNGAISGYFRDLLYTSHQECGIVAFQPCWPLMKKLLQRTIESGPGNDDAMLNERE